MAQLYQDSMAIIRQYGKPDLFITMTCNPKWEEIVSALKPGEITHDRPNLVTRVFVGKLQHLLDKLLKKGIFGEVVAHGYYKAALSTSPLATTLLCFVMKPPQHY